jgi:hypothetical protein
MKAFKQWDVDDVESSFGLVQVPHMDVLTAWMAAHEEYTSGEQREIALLQQTLLENAAGWNEEELKFHFIAPLITFVNFLTPRYKAFLERTLKATINGISVGGDVDLLVATGKTKPHEPFFFLHEYKKEIRASGDPCGQLLIEMLAARELNTLKRPMYGCYVVGRSWFFVVLDGTQYAVSNALNASDEDLLRIVAILRRMKNIIEEYLG